MESLVHYLQMNIMIAKGLLGSGLALLLFLSSLIAQDTNSTQQPVSDCVRVAELMPVYPGGQTALLKFINDKVQLPVISLKLLQSSQLVIQFIVERDGHISSLQVIKSIHPEIDAAYLRAFETMPPWAPGQQRGQPIRVQMTFPIRIRFE